MLGNLDAIIAKVCGGAAQGRSGRPRARSSQRRVQRLRCWARLGGHHPSLPEARWQRGIVPKFSCRLGQWQPLVTQATRFSMPAIMQYHPDPIDKVIFDKEVVMARRSIESDADRACLAVYGLLWVAPTWVGLPVILALYSLFQWLIPMLVRPLGEPIGASLAEMSRAFVPWILLVASGAWILAVAKKVTNELAPHPRSRWCMRGL